MQIGMIGLGRMGRCLVRRLMAARHDGAVFDPDRLAAPRRQFAGHGEQGAGRQGGGS